MIVEYNISNYNYTYGVLNIDNATNWREDTKAQFEFSRTSSSGKQTINVDINSVSGNWNIFVGCVSYTGSSDFKIYKMWLEP